MTFIFSSLKIWAMNEKICLLCMMSGLFLLSCGDKEYIRKSEAVMGDYTDMDINNYDTILIGEYYSPHYFNLDLDNDSVEDIQFESEVWGSPGMGQHPRSVIKCLTADVKLFGYFTSDTSFLNRHTEVYQAIGNSYERYEYFSFTCHRIDVLDSILSISPEFKISPLSRNDILKKDDTFNADTLILIDDSFSYMPTLIGVEGDTTIYEYHTHLNDCNTFPLDKIRYIGIKMENEKLGWIMISISDKYKILILESGLQK